MEYSQFINSAVHEDLFTEVVYGEKDLNKSGRISFSDCKSIKYANVICVNVSNDSIYSIYVTKSTHAFREYSLLTRIFLVLVRFHCIATCTGYLILNTKREHEVRQHLIPRECLSPEVFISKAMILNIYQRLYVDIQTFSIKTKLQSEFHYLRMKLPTS
jgi:hypothetical protein